jgi:hypothetical protein
MTASANLLLRHAAPWLITAYSFVLAVSIYVGLRFELLSGSRHREQTREQQKRFLPDA